MPLGTRAQKAPQIIESSSQPPADDSCQHGNEHTEKPTLLPGFTQEQSSSLATYISATVAVSVQKSMEQVFREQLDKSLAVAFKNFGIGPNSSPNPPKNPEHQENEEEQESEKDLGSYKPPPTTKPFKADDIGFFDPEYQDGTTGPVANAGKHVIYRDIYTFVDRLKDIEFSYGEAIKFIIPECFRGAALMWYTIELTDVDKILLRAQDLDKWYTTLISRFKIRTSDALTLLTSQTYALNDVKYRSPRAWIQEMLHYAKAANLLSTHNQLTIIWNRLSVQLRQHIPEPSPSTTLSQFLKQIDSKTSIWMELANRPQHNQYQQRPQQNQYQPRPQQDPNQRPPHYPPLQASQQSSYQSRTQQPSSYQNTKNVKFSQNMPTKPAYMAESTPIPWEEDGNENLDDQQ